MDRRFPDRQGGHESRRAVSRRLDDLAPLLSPCAAASTSASAGNTRRSAILYNLGRVVSYTLVGAIVGALGSAFSLSTAVQAGIQLFAAAFMLAMALNLLGCFRFLPSLRLPGRLSGLFRSPFILRHRSG